METLHTQTPQVFTVQRADERYFADHGWLRSYHSFSFADYLDRNNINWGALRVFNDDDIAAGQGFGTHPHRDMEILTYVLSGQLEHRDSMGNRGVVGPGDVQYMSAGTGVSHSEFNHSASEPLHLVQMWVFPARNGEPPAYGQKEFTQAERTNKWLTIASGRADVEAPIALRQDASFHVARLEDTSLSYTFDPGRYGFLFVADGAIEANGERLGKGDAVRMASLGELTVKGTGEVVLWNVPPLAHGARG